MVVNYKTDGGRATAYGFAIRNFNDTTQAIYTGLVSFLGEGKGNQTNATGMFVQLSDRGSRIVPNNFNGPGPTLELAGSTRTEKLWLRPIRAGK
jgi:hypothetical protein